MNNKLIIGGIIAVVVVGGAIFYFSKGYSMPASTPTQTQTNTPSGSTTAAKNAVTIQNMAFSPATLTVKVGDSVTWTNQDSVGHSATANDSSFDTGVIAPGQSGSVTFNKAGTFAYHCSVHPSMQATIVVQ